MASINEVFITQPKYLIPISGILNSAMIAMSEGGHVKISNHTGRPYPPVSFGSAYDVFEKSIPKFYIYIKDSSYNLWEEYNGWRPGEKCKGPLTTLATESNIYQRMKTRIENPLSFRIQIFDKFGNSINAYDKPLIDLKS